MNGKLVRTFLDNREPLRAMLMERLGNEEDALDLLQETFVKVSELPETDGVGNPRAYLYRIAANLAVDRARDAGRRRRYFGAEILDVDATQSRQPNPEETAHNRARLQQVQRILDALPTNCRTAFLLSRCDGLTYAEIGRRMGVSGNMVKKHLVRALAALRTGLPAGN